MSLQSATGSLREAANEQQPLALAPPPPGSAAAPGWHPASLGARIPPPTARRLRTRDQAGPLGPRQHRGAEGKADSGGAVGSRRSRGEWAGLEQSGHALEASLCPPGGEGAGAAGRGGRGFQRALSTLPPASLHLSLLSLSLSLSPSLPPVSPSSSASFLLSRVPASSCLQDAAPAQFYLVPRSPREDNWKNPKAVLPWSRWEPHTHAHTHVTAGEGRSNTTALQA